MRTWNGRSALRRQRVGTARHERSSWRRQHARLCPPYRSRDHLEPFTIRRLSANAVCMKRRDVITLLGGAGGHSGVAASRARAAAGPRLPPRLLDPGRLSGPAIVAFFDELRLNGFVEGRNLDVIPDGFDVGRDQIEAKVVSIVKAAPDAIVSGPDTLRPRLPGGDKDNPDHRHERGHGCRRPGGLAGAARRQHDGDQHSHAFARRQAPGYADRGST